MVHQEGFLPICFQLFHLQQKSSINSNFSFSNGTPIFAFPPPSLLTITPDDLNSFSTFKFSLRAAFFSPPLTHTRISGSYPHSAPSSSYYTHHNNLLSSPILLITTEKQHCPRSVTLYVPESLFQKEMVQPWARVTPSHRLRSIY